MPACPRPRWIPAILIAATLAACERPAAPAAVTPAGCLTRAAAEPPPLPWVSLHARELAGASLAPEGRACVAAVLGTTPFASPQAYDADYAPVQAFHGEDTGLRLGAPAFERGLLVRIDAAADRGIWLLRIETGGEMEGGRYDVLFTTGADGHLRDTLLIGAEGVLYRRDANLLRADRFALIEQTGREETPGPTYAAAFTIDRDGRIALDPSGTAELRSALPVANAVEAAATAESDAVNEGPEAASSIDEVDGAPGDLSAIRRLLFPDETLIEESIMPAGPPAGPHGVLAPDSSGVAGFVPYLLEPAENPPAPGRTVHRGAGVAIAEPAGVLGATAGTIGWETGDGGAVVTLPIDYAFERSGGDARPGEPDREVVARVVGLRYAGGQLHRIGD